MTKKTDISGCPKQLNAPSSTHPALPPYFLRPFLSLDLFSSPEFSSPALFSLFNIVLEPALSAKWQHTTCIRSEHRSTLTNSCRCQRRQCCRWLDEWLEPRCHPAVSLRHLRYPHPGAIDALEASARQNFAPDGGCIHLL